MPGTRTSNSSKRLEIQKSLRMRSRTMNFEFQQEACNEESTTDAQRESKFRVPARGSTDAGGTINFEIKQEACNEENPPRTRSGNPNFEFQQEALRMPAGMRLRNHYRTMRGV